MTKNPTEKSRVRKIMERAMLNYRYKRLLDSRQFEEANEIRGEIMAIQVD